MNKFIFFFVGISIAHLTLFSISHASVKSDLLKDIKLAQAELSKTQAKINRDRVKLSNKLREQENLVSKLRDGVSVSQRLQDEKTLSLQQLQGRLKVWNEQNQYQQNSLSRFNQNIAYQALSVNATTQQKLTWLNGHINQLTQHLYPVWSEEMVVMNNGELHLSSILSMGPMHWYLDKNNNHAGFASLVKSNSNEGTTMHAGAVEKNLFKAELPLSGDTKDALFRVKNSGIGSISFDPTLTRAFKIRNQKVTIMQHLKKGGVWILPILMFGIFAVSIALFKAFQFWRLPPLIPDFNQRFAQLEKIKIKEDRQKSQNALFHCAKGMQAELIKIALETELGQKRDDRLFANLLNNKHSLDYWLGAIAITASVSPLLGLLGTVSGMIETFKLMTLFGAGDPAAVSGGISQALVTTEVGLVVAIPALILHALLSRASKNYYIQLETCGINLSQLERN